MGTQHDTVRDLLDRHGTTYAEAADIAVSAARELFAAGWRTPQRMREATWQQRVDALGRGSYRRYDESTATKLEEGATFLLEEHGGDMHDVWPEVSPYFDKRALAVAHRHGLPTDPDERAALAPRGRVAHLAAALVRTDLEE